MMIWKQFFKNLSHSWTRHFKLQCMSLSVLCSIFTLSLCLILVFYNIYPLIHDWGHRGPVRIYLKQEAKTAQIKKLSEEIEKDPFVKEIQVLSRKSTLKRLKMQSENPSFHLFEDKELADIVPVIIDVQLTLSGKMRKEKIKPFIQKINQSNIVEDIAYGQRWEGHHKALLNLSKVGGTFLMLLLLLSTLCITGNCMRNSIYQRSREIEVLHIIGARKNQIQVPFIFEGAFLCLLALGLSYLLSYLIFIQVQKFTKYTFFLLKGSASIDFFHWPYAFGFIAFALMCGSISAWICFMAFKNKWNLSD